MQKILIIKLGALGDFVLEIGSMMSIRRRFPDAELTLMTNSAFLTMARQMGIFTDYIIDNRVSYLNLREQSRLVREVTQGGFEYIFDLQGELLAGREDPRLVQRHDHRCRLPARDARYRPLLPAWREQILP